MSKKKTTGFVAGAAGVALLLGGATFALWNDEAEVDGGTITAGNLDVELAEPAWFDISDGGEDSIELDTFKIVPGDSIRGKFPIGVALEGDNLEAKLSFNAGDIGGDLMERLIDFDFSVVTPGGVEGGPYDSLSLDLSPKDFNPDFGEEGFNQEEADLTAVVTMTFDPATPNQDLVQSQLALENAGVELVQKPR